MKYIFLTLSLLITFGFVNAQTTKEKKPAPTTSDSKVDAKKSEVKKDVVTPTPSNDDTSKENIKDADKVESASDAVKKEDEKVIDPKSPKTAPKEKGKENSTPKAK